MAFKFSGIFARRAEPAQAAASLPAATDAAAAPAAGKYGAEREALILQAHGMGDCLFAIPIIKDMVTSHTDRSFDLFTHHPELFRRCPYVGQVHAIGDPAIDDYTVTRKLFELDKLRHFDMDTMDFISIPIRGGQLSFREKQLEYFPQEDDRAGTYDVVLNTSATWPTRTWKLENWQRLADTLMAKGFSVAVVGKDIESPNEDMQKLSYPLERCDNLVNRLSLDQTYFTIAKCRLFVSCQNGLSVLAGATDTEIVVLGMSIEWSKRALYRRASPLHKIAYVEGGCGIYCCTNKHCQRPEYQGDGNFLCVPSYDAVEAAVLGKLV